MTAALPGKGFASQKLFRDRPSIDGDSKIVDFETRRVTGERDLQCRDDEFGNTADDAVRDREEAAKHPRIIEV